MAQNKFMIDGVEVWQPDTDPVWSWETMYTEDSSRDQYTGAITLSPMWATQRWTYKATAIPASEVSKILKLIVSRPSKPTYTVHMWSTYDAAWVDIECYTGDGEATAHELVDGEEIYEEFSFDMVGVAKLI